MQNGGDNYKKCKPAQTVQMEMPQICGHGHEWRRAFWQPYGEGLQYPLKVLLSGNQRSPLGFRLAGHHCQLPPCFMLQVRAASSSAKKKACTRLFRVLVELELVELHRGAKTGFSSTNLNLLLQYIPHTHMEKAGLP